MAQPEGSAIEEYAFCDGHGVRWKYLGGLRWAPAFKDVSPSGKVCWRWFGIVLNGHHPFFINQQGPMLWVAQCNLLSKSFLTQDEATNWVSVAVLAGEVERALVQEEKP